MALLYNIHENLVNSIFFSRSRLSERKGNKVLFNLIIGILAGYASRYFGNALSSVLTGKYKIPKTDIPVLTFILLLLAASILIGLGRQDGLPFILVFGGGIGFFHKYLGAMCKEQYTLIKAKIKDRKDMNNEI